MFKSLCRGAFETTKLFLKYSFFEMLLKIILIIFNLLQRTISLQKKFEKYVEKINSFKKYNLKNMLKKINSFKNTIVATIF